MKFSILLSNNNRSKAYLQNLIKSGHIPGHAIVLDAGNSRRPENTERDLATAGHPVRSVLRESKDAGIYFDEGQHVLDTLSAANVDHTLLKTMNINSEEVISAARQIDEDYIVYSGPGGAILRPEILSLSKEFIHVHPGWLPEYRGSTTMYYSILTSQTVSCSVFFMREKIDAGPLLYQKTLQISETEIDLDYVLDPCVRTAALLEFFSNTEEYIKQVTSQEGVPGNSFYIIHPVLKHLAILKTRENSKATIESSEQTR